MYIVLHPRNRLSWVACALVIGLATAATSVVAQTGPAPQGTKPPRDKYGSPLDTLMSTRLWTDVPPTQDFVKATHPDPKTLDYTPLTGKDPERPKPRDPANVAALRAELEQDGARNAKQATGLADAPATSERTKKAAKPKASKSKATKPKAHAAAD